jgi:hypothetical protein
VPQQLYKNAQWGIKGKQKLVKKKEAFMCLLHVQCQLVKLHIRPACLQFHMNIGMCCNTLTSLSNDQVQKRVQIRMDALQKYIDTILENACKLVTEQFASSGFSISDPDLSPGGVMCGPNDTLSSSVFNQLSVSSMYSHSPGGKPSSIEGPPLLLQK